MVRVSAADVAEQFDRLLEGACSREAVEAWAEERMRALDEGRLTFDPPADEERLWRGIHYLLGVGLQNAPGHYLHSVEDFRAFRRDANL